MGWKGPRRSTEQINPRMPSGAKSSLCRGKKSPAWERVYRQTSLFPKHPSNQLLAECEASGCLKYGLFRLVINKPFVSFGKLTQHFAPTRQALSS